ncbi:MAG: hypothetical protein ACK559_08495, partial [bacterium]
VGERAPRDYRVCQPLEDYQRETENAHFSRPIARISARPRPQRLRPRFHRNETLSWSRLLSGVGHVAQYPSAPHHLGKRRALLENVLEFLSIEVRPLARSAGLVTLTDPAYG